MTESIKKKRVRSCSRRFGGYYTWTLYFGRLLSSTAIPGIVEHSSPLPNNSNACWKPKQDPFGDYDTPIPHEVIFHL